MCGGVRVIARLARRDMRASHTAMYLAGVSASWAGIILTAWRVDLAGLVGPIEASLAWFGAGLIPFSVLQVHMFERLFTDEKHEAEKKATDDRLKAMEADIEMLKTDRKKDAEEIKTLKFQMGIGKEIGRILL